MREFLILLLAGAASTPVIAQQTDHGGHTAPPPSAEEQAEDRHSDHTDPHAGQQTTEPPDTAADPHAGHSTPPPADPHAEHGTPAQPAADPHAGHGMPPPTDPHTGHGTATQPATDPHAGHDMTAQDGAAPPVAPPPPEATSGPAHAADSVYGASEMAGARAQSRMTHGAMRFHKFTIDQLEYSLRGGADGFAWEDAQFWYGGDLNKLWIKSEGEGTFDDGVEAVEVQALWSRAISPFFDVQAGLRYDFGEGPDRGHLVLGVQGLAPYWFEVDAAAFLSEKGDLTARVEVEYDQRITQRLILQPRVELDLSLQDVPELGIGAGLSTAEAGIRLRYEIVPEFAPYVGVQYERAFGDTADFRRAAGENVGGWSLVAGIRAWF